MAKNVVVVSQSHTLLHNSSFNMTRAAAILLVAAALARAHGDHAHNIQSRADDESLSYAERHVRISISMVELGLARALELELELRAQQGLTPDGCGAPY